MKKLGLGLLGIFAVLVLIVVAIFAASELGGEVVVLETTDSDGSSRQTHLWVVQSEGTLWLRAGDPTSGWLQRLEANPIVSVTRGAETRRYRAIPVRDPEVRDRIHALMRERYPAADRLISMVRDDAGSIPVRLEPAEADL